MPLCTLDNLNDYLHRGYLDAFEAENPGLAERLIASVSGEIEDLLRVRYPLPWPVIPSALRHIAAVFSAYRTAEAITSVVDSEGNTENEWIPLQTEYKRADALLKDIAKGTIKLPLEMANVVGEVEEPSIAVVSPRPYFDMRGF